MIRTSVSAAFMAVGVAACVAAEPGGVVFVDQGWTNGERSTYYHLEQGSQLMPYKWLSALRQPYSNQPFLADDHLRSLRFLPDERGPHNPDGLPVGFAKTVDREGREWVGLSCAACHTSQLRYEGTEVRLEGGQGLIEFAAIVDTTVAALEATWRNPQRFQSFARDVLGDACTDGEQADLRTEVREHARFLADLGGRSRPAYPAGWGRMDAYNVLFNEFLGTALNEPRNYIVPYAPASIPSIWLVPQLDFCTYNASIHDLMARDVAEVVGIFGRISTDTAGGGFGVESSGTPGAFRTIELALQKLQPPQWPESVFGMIDRNLAERGKKVYAEQNCASCHGEKPPYPQTDPNDFGRTFIDVKRVPLDDVGTDPLETVNFADRMAFTGMLKPQMGGNDQAHAWQMFVVVLTELVKGKLSALGLAPQALAQFTYERGQKFPPADELKAYIAEPLAGVWATPPFLHNGSVPNLEELLLPPEQRSKTFHVGSRDYDPKRMGYVSEETADSFEFDTSIPGNSNSGHTYGTKINDEERRALLEYLKTF